MAGVRLVDTGWSDAHFLESEPNRERGRHISAVRGEIIYSRAPGGEGWRAPGSGAGAATAVAGGDSTTMT